MVAAKVADFFGATKPEGATETGSPFSSGFSVLDYSQSVPNAPKKISRSEVVVCPSSLRSVGQLFSAVT